MIVVLLKSGDLPAFAAHRHIDDWEVSLTQQDTCFLRLPYTEEFVTVLQHLPCLKRWILQNDSELIPFHKTLPEQELPSLSWLPLHTLLPAIPATAKENEDFFGHLSFALEPDAQLREPAGLLLQLSAFAQWAETAPAPRLDKLRFALSTNGKALVLGKPLPPLTGESIYQEGQLLIPSGFALPAYILPEDLANSPGEIFLLEKDGTLHKIGRELFVNASRAAIRLTTQALT